MNPNIKFTITSVLLSATGRYIVAPNATEEYLKQALDEINSNAVYKYIYNEQAKEDYVLKEGTYDPVIRMFLCSIVPEIKTLVRKVDQTSLDANDTILKENTLIPLPQLDFSNYFAYTIIADRHEKEKELRIKEEQNKVDKKEKSRKKTL